MDKKEEFKEYISKHPELINYVKNKKNTWQDLYEIYDIYGENEEAWKKLKTEKSNNQIEELTNILKNINMDNVQKYVTNAQKAINIIKELTGAGVVGSGIKNVNTEVTQRPINKFYGD